MEKLIASIGYAQAIAGAVCALFGFLIACAVAYPLIKKRILEEQIKQADQRAEGWRELAEQREATIKQRDTTIEEFKAKVEEVRAEFSSEIKELQDQLTQIKETHRQTAEENQFVKDENIVLQRTNRTLAEEKRCVVEERDLLRQENLRINQHLVESKIQNNTLENQVTDLLKRLHSQGEETRE